MEEATVLEYRGGGMVSEVSRLEVVEMPGWAFRERKRRFFDQYNEFIDEAVEKLTPWPKRVMKSRIEKRSLLGSWYDQVLERKYQWNDVVDVLEKEYKRASGIEQAKLEIEGRAIERRTVQTLLDFTSMHIGAMTKRDNKDNTLSSRHHPLMIQIHNMRGAWCYRDSGAKSPPPSPILRAV